MKESDLRIGNYVYYEHTTHIVDGIYENKVYSWWVKDREPVIEYEMKDVGGAMVKNPYRDAVNQYEPIPLTEEWLIKLGFEKNITTDLYPTFSYDIVNVNDGIVYVLNYGFVNHIKYVHQLQNLYFTLTREELKLK
jgi:hypothetical protein